ncbi:MAG: hypothetical protein ACOC24_04060 [Desulfovibrionales bacterium]
MEKEYEKIEQEVRTQPKDWGKLALFIALLSVLLMVVLFFGLNQNVTGMKAAVERIESEDLSAMKEQIASFDQRMSELERLPEMARQAIVSATIDEMLAKTEYLRGQLPEGLGNEKLEQVRTGLNELKSQIDSE